jgi:hypothetical protein
MNMINRFAWSAFAIAVVASGTFVVAELSSAPGRFVVWGADTDPLVVDGAPSGEFVSLAAGGAQQTLALRADRRLFINAAAGQAPPVPAALASDPFCAVGMGRNHGLAIRPNGRIAAWPEVAADGAPNNGEFVAVTGAAGYYSIALDTHGKIVMWGGSGLSASDYPKVVGVGPPKGRFKAIAARGRYTLALSEDGKVYGWGTGTPAGTDYGVFTSTWTPDGSGHFVAPMEVGNPYTAIAAGLNLVVALRADGSIAQWGLTNDIPGPPTGIVFIQIAAGASFAAGIDDRGQLHAWGNSTGTWIDEIPAAVYSAVSAATSHVAAIEAPRQFVWPANHQMKTIVLTFRADDNCTPVSPSGLSVELRSNQPDDGFGSGHTTGDTNGQDGYSGPVVLPATAIQQNGDGSFAATFEVRAEQSGAWPGPRTYTVAIVSADGATPPNTSRRITAQIVVSEGGM